MSDKYVLQKVLENTEIIKKILQNLKKKIKNYKSN